VNLLTDPDTSDANNVLSFGIVQPLLNGFGPLVSKEPLRQAERDMVYAVRDFKRFQQDFVIDIASQYYSTLRSRDQMINQRSRYESAVANRERSESLVRAGRIPDFQASQSRLSELNAADGWTLAKANYEAALDDLRFTLGLPIDVNVEPDPRELERLADLGLVELGVTLDMALDYAVSNRLDLISKRQQVEDRERKLEISRRNFLPNLDVDYEVSKSFENDSGEDVSQDLAVRLNLPFDWTEKRNAYRRAQIALDREQRALDEDESDIIRNVRDLWRKLIRNRSVYENRKLSVELSERTVEQTSLLLKQGRALTRDLLDAEDDLTDARNAMTLALVDFTINRMRFWNTIERFEIDSKGMWYEYTETEKPVEEAQD
jgi:outer membrane protein TolC